MGKKGKIGKQRKDRYYHLAKETGYRSRASFKLIQLNRKFEFLQKSKVLIDLCAAPGGWLQVAQKYMPVSSIIIGVDLVPIKPIHNVITLQEDITTQKCRSMLAKELKTWKVDVVLNDGAPNVGKSWIHDAYEQNRLTLSALHLACDFLIKGGWFVTKVFRSKDYNSLMWVFKKLFQRVHATKPQASRNESAEIFVACQNFIAPDKIDPKFFDPGYVFAEIKDKEQKLTKGDLLKPVIKPKKAKAEGYEEGEILLYNKINASEFIKSVNYIDLMSKANEIILDSEAIKNHESTTSEIIECIKDLKVLGRKELVSVINWRQKLRDSFKQTDQNVVTNEIEEKQTINASENDVDDVEEIDDEQSEEAQKLKRKKRKIAKEKRKLSERMNLKMVLKDDQFVQEEQDLFTLKNVKKNSLINSTEDSEFEMLKENNSDDELAFKNKKSKIFYDKEGNERYFDPDDSDVSDDDDDLQESLTLNSKNEYIEENDENEENELIVDLESKNDKVKNLTKMFFDNKIFNKDNIEDVLHEDSNEETDHDEDIELEELENRFKKPKKNLSNEPFKEVSINENNIPNVQLNAKQDEESDSSDEDDENKIPKQESKMLSPEELAMGAIMIKSQKSKRDLVNNSWNRYMNEDDEFIPSWLRKEEQLYYRKPIPVSNEMVKEYNEKLKEINSKPIKKVMEAKARKKKRALRRLEKARIKAETVTDDADMTNKEKAQYIRSIYKKAIRKDKNKVQLVVAKKQYGNRRPPGVKGRYKVVDSRMKKDKRNLKNGNKKGRKSKK